MKKNNKIIIVVGLLFMLQSISAADAKRCAKAKFSEGMIFFDIGLGMKAHEYKKNGGKLLIKDAVSLGWNVFTKKGNKWWVDTMFGKSSDCLIIQ